ncbi:MAG: cytochrome-c peroxidase [Bacteroidetes bacterium]|nr:MAG: cytochrome-c peroxidase [Bacteroidota bacterium]
MRKLLFLLSLGMVLLACDRANRPYPFPPSPLGEVPEPEHNPTTVYGVELGRKLFFDPRLSSTTRVNCVSCHFPVRAFSDGRKLTSMGVSGNRLLRHSPALFNLAWTEGTFWDGGAKNLESQVFGPITHPDEMGMDLTKLTERLQADEEYRKLFKKAWGTDSITTVLIARSLAQYERTLISDKSFYDRVKAGKAEGNAQWQAGYSLYQSHCSNCHTEGLFTDNCYHNNGLDTAFLDRRFELIYMGRYRITGDSTDIGKFKTPALRNLGFTAPFMHDGRLRDLDAVLQHYNEGIQPSATLDSTLPQGGLHLSKEELAQLKYFLLSLNDSTFVGR